MNKSEKNGLSEFNFSSHTLNYRVILPERINDRFFEIGKCFIPDLEESNNTKPIFTFIGSLGNPDFKLSKKTFQIISNGSLDNLCYETVKLISKKIEEDYANIGAISVHAAAVSNNGTGVLIMGPTHAGKSTLAMKSCLENNFSYISGDRVLLKDTTIVGGTKSDTLRYASFNRDLNLDFPIKIVDNLNLWSEQVVLDMSEYLKIESGQKNIEAIVFAQHHPSSSYFKELTDIAKKTIKLYDSLVFFLDTYPSLLYSAKTPLPPSKNDLLREQRFNLAEKLSSFPCYSLVGTFSYMSGQINSLLQGGSK
ncbi:MAG: hypothetical protein KJ583_01255 [Nanoarchaeota archaeon]|nr:hypothetical protein [Nanoarchaeota archaeon]MBU1269457.1 hypothetical protein [Nanoarchaeota archaeon]MBU1603919.1 hypothetical protein [Nanoarchaeota archaeon]MBU2443481.1 hypothetical protein [Nanoarchaeota archaeon]